MKLISQTLFFLLLATTIACKKTVEYFPENKIIITNTLSQKVTGTLYPSYQTFSIAANETYTYIEKGEASSSFSFGDSDSLTMKFEDGKKKTDYYCAKAAVNQLYPDCSKDKANPLYSLNYIQIKVAEQKYQSYYNITQADYDEAK